MIIWSMKAHERARGTMKLAQRIGTIIKDHMYSYKDGEKQNATEASIIMIAKHGRKCARNTIFLR
jgi:hypothetical protein